jgi:hypothetical protein
MEAVPRPAHKRHKRGSRARVRAGSSSEDVAGSDSGDADGLSSDGVEPTACPKCGRHARCQATT